MNKVVFAGLFGIVVAILLAIFGIQSGFFDSFRKTPVFEDPIATGPSGETAEPAGTASPTGDATSSSSAQKSDETAPAATPGSTMAPTFDVVRVEPTGDAVVAGLAEPNATVALVANGKVIGKTKSNASGEWAIVLNTPLAPGDYDVAIHVEQANGVEVESSQRVAVSIPADKDGGDVLVVMNAEGEASTILQRPAGDAEPGAPTVIASSEAEAGAPAGTAASDTAQSPATMDEGNTGETSTAQAVDEAAGTAAVTEASAGSADDQPADTSGETEVADASTDAAADTSAAPDTSAEHGKTTSVAGLDASAGASGVSTPAAATATAEAEPAPAKPTDAGYVTVDAVESEKGKLFVAGTSKPDARIRVYLGSDYLGETRANANGRWLLETKHPVEPGQHDVRADVIKDDSGAVVARAQVTFDRQPDAVILTQVAATGETGEGGAGGASATASARLPNVIIRKGDNLWTISRRLYGKGIRYTTIYQANQGQIRNPDLIYPGQVFLTPVGDDAWEKDAATN